MRNFPITYGLVLYLKGISIGCFSEALILLRGNAKDLSSGMISRLKQHCQEEYKSGSQHDLNMKKYVYIWAYGVYFNVLSEETKQCRLVVIRVNEYETKELIAINEGYHEST